MWQEDRHIANTFEDYSSLININNLYKELIEVLLGDLHNFKQKIQPDLTKALSSINKKD